MIHQLPLLELTLHSVLIGRPIVFLEPDMASDLLGIEYGPTDTGKLSEEARLTFESFYSKLRQFRDELPSAFHSKLLDSHLKDLALSLLDGTVFEIVKELEDIQQLSERAFLNRRMKVVSSHKTQRVEMVRRHKEELASCQNRPHNLPLVKSRHEKEIEELEKVLVEELRSTDQKIILELDQIVTDQQSTMQQAAVPLFTVTNNPHNIQIQIHILSFIQRLSTSQ